MQADPSSMAMMRGPVPQQQAPIQKVSFDDALASLQSMFSEWDRDTLVILLESNQYHLEKTIEQCLAMSGGVPESELMQSAQLEANDQFPTFDTREEPKQKVAKDSRFRGRKCELPESFLRTPGWRQQSAVLADEQLAAMLQNELFQLEVQRTLGQDYMADQRGNVRPGYNRTQSQVQHLQSKTPTNSSSSGGIMKGLSEMGAGMKRRLSNLAMNFRSRSSTTRPLDDDDDSYRREAKGTDYRSGSSGSGTSEAQPMLGDVSSNPMIKGETSKDDDDDDEFRDLEEISFLESPSARGQSHSLEMRPITKKS